MAEPIIAVAHARRRPASPSCARANGFSILELVVVLAMLMVVATIAIPSIVTSLTATRVRSGMGDLAALFMNARTQAVRTNTITRVRFTLTGQNWIAYVDNGSTPTGLSSSQRQIALPRQFSKVAAPTGTNPAPLTTATCGSTVALDTTDDTYFNQMGTPCQYSSGSCNASQAFVHYFNYQGGLSTTNWAAMCVSSAGRVKPWYWNGSAWQN